MQVEIDATFMKAILILEIRENFVNCQNTYVKIYFPLVTKFISLNAERLLYLAVRVSFDQVHRNICVLDLECTVPPFP